MEQPTWFLTKNQYNSTKTMKAYKVLITKIVSLLNPNNTAPIDKIDSMIKLETKFAKVFLY